MDYDDNDFHSHNPHLAGEGSNKFPPVLRPYALPKFDFDESLNGSLRFDSLVETEVFLGIESTEDSQWIEDFSRGSGGIQFSSSAAESCSIPRRNNVWSEATSSESVEMLLKSVGQEELIPPQTNSKGSDVCDELGCIIKQMDPKLKQDSNIAARVEDVTNLQLASLPSHFPERIPGLDDNGGGQQPKIEDSSKSHKNDTSADRSLAVSVEVSLPVAESSLFVDGKRGDVNQIEVHSIVNESLDNRIQESSASGTQVDNVVATVQNIILGNDGPTNEDASNYVNEIADEELNASGTNEEHHEKVGVLSRGAQMHTQVLNAEVIESSVTHLDDRHCVSSMESVEETKTIETNVEEPCVIPNEDPSTEICDQHAADAHKGSQVVIEGNPTVERHEAENQVDQRCGSYEAVNSSSPELSASAEFIPETNAEGHVSSSALIENDQMCEKEVPGQINVNKGVSVEQKDNVVLPSIGRDMDGVIDKGAETFSLGEDDTGKLVVSKSQSDSTAGEEAANAVQVSSGDGINKDAIFNRKVEVSCTCSDTDKDIAAKISAEASVSDLAAAPEVTTGVDSVSESKKGSAAAAEEELHNSANDSGAYGSSSESQIEPRSAVIEKVGQECTKDKAALAVCDSTIKGGDNTEALVKEKGNYEKEHIIVSDPTVSNEMPGPMLSATEESLQDTSCKIQKEKVVRESGDTRVEQIAVASTSAGQEGTADFDKSTSIPPTLIRNSEVSPDKSTKEGIKKSLDQSSSVSEVTDCDAIKVQSATKHPNKNDSSKDDSSFTFEVSPLTKLPGKEAKKKQAFSNIEVSKVSPIVDGSTPSPGLGQLDLKVTQDLSHGSPRVPNVAIVRSGSKSNSERKPRRASGKAAGKETAKKGSSARETPSGKLERGEKLTSVSLSPSGVSQLVQSNKMQRFGSSDSNIIKPFVLATSTAGLPDLNSSVSPAAVFRQPFTDLQQVQLRAQIFVYGALIQGTAPDEACMISAFGGPDGGRSIWENAWRSCVERLRGQKSQLVAPETPLQSHSGARAPEQSVKQSGLQSKAFTSPIAQGSSKGTPVIVSPIVPFSSPLWSMPTPSGDALQPSGMPRGPVVDYQRAVSPLHPHQTSGIRNFVSHNPSWLPQASYGGPWMASPQTSAFDTSGRFSVQLPGTETVQLMPVKELSVHHSSAAKPAVPPAQNAASVGILTGTSSVLDTKVTALGGQPSNDPKPRKRKKNSVSDNTAQIVLSPQPQTESVSASAIGSSLPTSIVLTTPVCVVSKAPAERLFTSPPQSSGIRKENTEPRANLSEESFGKIKEAKVQAEEAVASAASAVSHSQQVWDQLGRLKNSGLSSDVEIKLASAAVAVAAAAAVAKAAAAAAKVASDAALQAKLMAEEAVALGDQPNPYQNIVSLPDGMKTMGKATPASILKGDDGTSSSSSILVAAREAARKRVEAASAAAKRAENMDAIVKAAELAAEAVSQAGKIVAMSDPLPLSELVAAGPEGYWRVPVTPELISRSNDAGRENPSNDGGAEDPNTLTGQLKEVPSDKKENHIASYGQSHASREGFSEDHNRLIVGLPGPGATMVKDIKMQKGRKASDLAITVGVVPESENGSRTSVVQNGSEKEESLKEESIVEVFKEGSGFKAAWYPAKVTSLNDGKAYVEYTELTLGEGSEKLKEWVPLEGKGDEAPKIRIARPTTIVIPFEKTRKRRRAAMGDHTWSVGDKVDAWIQDSWWEGVITEKSKKGDSMLTVNFPAREETSILPAWQLLPSLIWKNGVWVEWSSSGENSRSSHGGDTPQEKRPRMRSPVVEAKGKDKASQSVDAVDSDKSDDPTLLALSTDEKLFNIGKSSRDEHKTDALRVKRTGLQKEGSRVIFGVPKPGKKRKFMEVSKHYVANRSGHANEANDSLKFTKYLMPQGPGSRGWKSSKPETNEKRAAISKPKVLKSGKPQMVSSRTIPQKDNLSNTAASVPDSSSVMKDSANHAENTSEKQNVTGFQSFSTSERTTEGPILFSALPPPSDTVSSKRLPSSNAKPERASKGKLGPAPSKLEGKLGPAASKLGKIEEDKTLNGDSAKSTSDAVEPRRSNRRIQPTSRLLEGIQSSMMVSKIPSMSHDRSHKSRIASRGNNHG